MNSLLSTKNLSVSVAGKQVCREMDLEINHGECWAILGTNGIGKTTLLHTLAGLRESEAGEIYYASQPIIDMSPRQLACFRAVLFQEHSDPFPATVKETVAVGRHPFEPAWQWYSTHDNGVVADSLEKVDMQSFSGRIISTLSGGERQRVSIAATLAQTPKIFMLDEPVSHLDLYHQMKIMDLMANQKKQDTAVIMILHDINLASRYCDHALLIYGDGKTESGLCSDLLNCEKLSALYGYPILQVQGDGKSVFVPG